MDNGSIVEFAKPSTLIKNEQGLFYNLVNKSVNSENIKTMWNN